MTLNLCKKKKSNKTSKIDTKGGTGTDTKHRLASRLRDFDIIFSQTLQTSSKFYQHVLHLYTKIKNPNQVFSLTSIDIYRAITINVKLQRRNLSYGAKLNTSRE